MRKTIVVMLVFALALTVSCRPSRPGVSREPSIAAIEMPAAAFLTPAPSSAFAVTSTVVPANTSVPAVVAVERVLDREELRWRECETGWDGWQQAEACLGYPLFALGGPTAVRTESGDLVLQVGGDLYETRTRGDDLLRRASLYRNGRRIKTILGGTPFHSPNISLQAIDGKVAWEFYGESRATIVYDGVDLRRQYGLDAAYRPYELGGKLIFIGQRDDRYVIMYDGRPVAPEFDEITIGYCCETVLYSPRFGEGRYLFWGRRDGRMRVVEITAANGADR